MRLSTVTALVPFRDVPNRGSNAPPLRSPDLRVSVTSLSAGEGFDPGPVASPHPSWAGQKASSSPGPCQQPGAGPTDVIMAGAGGRLPLVSSLASGFRSSISRCEMFREARRLRDRTVASRRVSPRGLSKGLRSRPLGRARSPPSVFMVRSCLL